MLPPDPLPPEDVCAETVVPATVADVCGIALGGKRGEVFVLVMEAGSMI